MDFDSTKEDSKMLSREMAIRFLFGTKEHVTINDSYLDEFGNYVFQTDYVTSVPNSASGALSNNPLIISID